MNAKKIVVVLVIAIVGLSTMNAQEMNHSKMKKDSTKMEMDHSKMKKDSTKMKMDHSKMEMDHSQMEMKATYTCPMHPEVVSDKPGDCPKCGMKLTETTPEKENEHQNHNH